MMFNRIIEMCLLLRYLCLLKDHRNNMQNIPDLIIRIKQNRSIDDE